MTNPDDLAGVLFKADQYNQLPTLREPLVWLAVAMAASKGYRVFVCPGEAGFRIAIDLPGGGVVSWPLALSADCAEQPDAERTVKIWEYAAHDRAERASPGSPLFSG